MNADSLQQAIKEALLQSAQESTNIYKTMLSEQHETYELIVYIWIAITAIFISGTLFWNFYLSNKKIKIKIEETELELKKELGKHINKKIKTINKTNQNFQDKINELLKNQQKENIEIIEKNFKKNKTEINLRFIKIEADSHRSFGNSGLELKQYWTAITQYILAINYYQKSDQPEMVSRCLNLILKCLSKKECKIQYIAANDGLYDSIINIISSLPGYLEDKKEKATKLLASLKN